jgi:hypothetical protein
MTKFLLLFIATSVFSTFYSPSDIQIQLERKTTALYQNTETLANAFLELLSSQQNQLAQTEKMLHKEAPTLKPEIINDAIVILDRANKKSVNYKHILTIIDYSLNADQKRLWIFDLNQQKLLFHTYVSHGIKSGSLVTNHFSNKFNSKCSSIGVYTTEKSYYGRDGLSLRLKGWEAGLSRQPRMACEIKIFDAFSCHK